MPLYYQLKMMHHISIIMERCVCACEVFEQSFARFISAHTLALCDILSSVLLRRRRWQQRIDNEAEM